MFCCVNILIQGRKDSTGTVLVAKWRWFAIWAEQLHLSPVKLFSPSGPDLFHVLSRSECFGSHNQHIILPDSSSFCQSSGDFQTAFHMSLSCLRNFLFLRSSILQNSIQISSIHFWLFFSENNIYNISSSKQRVWEKIKFLYRQEFLQCFPDLRYVRIRLRWTSQGPASFWMVLDLVFLDRSIQLRSFLQYDCAVDSHLSRSLLLAAIV